ncbi:MAG: hypothetical protein H6696_02120 [Deferribacteres bacterium]|nr:hypothetical protein [candidate division KSB1 bacterium]MCB9500709.1 hypothetical protein [Deferribacteres bacterium]
MKYKLFLLVGFSIFLFSMAMQAQEPQPELAPPPEEEDALRPETMKDPFVVAATPVSEEQKAEALQFLGELVPEAVPALAELENEKPHAYERELRQALREKRILERQKIRDRKEYENSSKRIVLQHKTKVLAYQYRKAVESDKPALKKQLRNQLSELFDMREQDRELEIQHLEKRLNELRLQLQKRKPNKEKIIEKRLDTMLGVDKELQW